ncbi:hypothetical protein [Salinicoccus halitifaciens]|uniref:Uncharacterized protein n=1 Tax=Salinicoccus halitifaciens TaxID=1073415 RepID=A0ABV2E8M8_9STAP|nr:hypothetical protein [Salinicoccus halitifaciens]MCD2137896.1 hypothetical protein [Salinicoccus halitifaciens]
MEKDDMMIKRIGSKNISEKALYRAIYKSLGLKARMNKTITPGHLQSHTVSKTLIHHPFWMVKSMVLADRPPFPPRKIPRMIFVDAVSGYRGIFSHVPPVTEEAPGEKIEPHITEEDLQKYVDDVRKRQIDKQYMLKKPRHETVETTLAHLPVYEVKVESAEVDETFYINANTGEDEQFLSERWTSKKDLLG